MRRQIPLGLLYIIIFFTGAAGLIYQVTWQKYLSRLMGSDSMATAIVLAVFLGGLSLGYYLYGRLSTVVKNHFKVYAVMEGAIGVWCLFFPNIFKAVDGVTKTWSFASPYLFIFQGLFTTCLLIGLPTVFMGSTIPLLTRGISQTLHEATNVHAKIYAINTAGAFLGTLLAGFYLIPELGLPLTILATAFLNLGAFLAIYLLQGWLYVEQKGKETIPTQPFENHEDEPQADPSAHLVISPIYLYLIAFLSGFYVMTLENVFIRIINLSLGSSSYSFSLIVAVFILSIAIGSYLVGRLRHIPKNLLYFNQFFIAFTLLVIYLTVDSWPYWAHLIRIAIQSNTIGFWAFYALIFMTLLLVLFTPVGLMGATVPITFHEIKRELSNVGRHSGYLFSMNTIGSLTGSVIGGIILFYFLNIGQVLLVAVLLAALSTLLAGLGLTRAYHAGSWAMAIITVALLFTGLFYNPHNFALGCFRLREPRPYSLEGPKAFFKKFSPESEIKYYNDGPTGTVAVTTSRHWDENGKQALSIVVNGKSDSNTLGDAATLKLSSHLPALLSEHRDKIMVIGLGTGVSASQFALYPDTGVIDVAEISPSVIKALPYFSYFTQSVQTNPKLSLHLTDAFRWLKRCNATYDIILSEPSNPWVTGVDSLFTSDFYALVNEHLADSGIFLQWIHLYAADRKMVSMVLNTVQNSFPYCHTFLACYADIVIVASKRELQKADLVRAKKMFDTNDQVRTSLSKIGIYNFEDILIREIWPKTYMADKYCDDGYQTLDNPRLHYMAGKTFFLGQSVPSSFLYNTGTTHYYQQYLLPRLYPDWDRFPIPAAVYQSMIKSLSFDESSPIIGIRPSLELKAALAAPQGIEFDPVKLDKLETALVPIAEDYPHSIKTWKDIGQEELSIRKKAQLLIEHVMNYRNWVLPYRIDGLKRLLKEGILSGKTDEEKNWCALQLMLINTQEDDDLESAKHIFQTLKKDKEGSVILGKNDLTLFILAKSRLEK